MSTQDSSSGDHSQQYLSKRVMINGQFVTLYSVNGVTWLSSPEDIPDTMARLDNTRVTLSEEKTPEGEKEKGDQGEKDAKGEKDAALAPKTPGSQYRMKGPKPRPILRQGGKVVEGTPIEPISASAVNIKGAADVSLPQVKFSPMEQGIRRGKIVAPIAQRRPGKVKVAPPPSKKVAASPVKVAPPSKEKAPLKVPAKQSVSAKLVKSVKAAPQNMEKGKRSAAPVRVALAKSAPSKAAPAKASKVAPKKAAKPSKAAKKVTPKKVVAKKSVSKSSSKRRSR